MRIFQPADNNAMSDAVFAVYGQDMMNVEALLFDRASRCSPDYKGGSWAFVTDDDCTAGFWYPLGQDTYKVEVPGNYYQNDAMDAMSFGAACTYCAANDILWMHHAKDRIQAVRAASDRWHKLRNWVFNLIESDTLSDSIIPFVD